MREFGLANRLAEESSRWWILVGFLVLLFFTGGGSRDDIQSLAIIRPVSALTIGYAIWVRLRSGGERFSAPFVLLAVLALIMVLQLIPLPPDLWTMLPNRSVYADIAAAAGLPLTWRPLTISPTATWNSLFSLLIPFAVLALFAIGGHGRRGNLFLVFFLLGSLSIFWALLQMAGESGGGLYLYRVTNETSPVGLFANRNHQALFLACMVAMAGYLFTRSFGGNYKRSAWAFVIAAASVIILLLIFLTGSRSGLAVGLLAFAYALWQMFETLFPASRKTNSARQSGRLKTRLWQGFILAAVPGLVFLLFYLTSSRSEALIRFLGEDDIAGRRGELFPILMEMVTAYLPFGSGFGTFEHAYNQFEPLELISSKYLNEAHNDFFQLLIESGIGGLLLLAAFAYWVGQRSFTVIRKASGENRKLAQLALVIMIFVSLVSIVDYPLRVPSIMALFTICCLTLEKSYKRCAEIAPNLSGESEAE